jgi:hypothetical protein
MRERGAMRQNIHINTSHQSRVHSGWSSGGGTCRERCYIENTHPELPRTSSACASFFSSFCFATSAVLEPCSPPAIPGPDLTPGSSCEVELSLDVPPPRAGIRAAPSLPGAGTGCLPACPPGLRRANCSSACLPPLPPCPAPSLPDARTGCLPACPPGFDCALGPSAVIRPLLWSA